MPTRFMHEAMTLSHHYSAAQALSPKAARLAARLLDASVGIPFEWRLSLRMALVERSRGAPPFTPTDLASLSGTNDPADPEVSPADQARRFILAVRNDRLVDEDQDI